MTYDTPGNTLGWDAYRSTDRGNYFANHFTVFDMNIFNVSNCSGLYPNTPELDQLICAGIILFLFFKDKFILKFDFFNGVPLFLSKGVYYYLENPTNANPVYCQG